jgi:manganese oxidase
VSTISLFGYGPLPWVDVFLLGWFALTAVSVGYVAWDNFGRNNPENTVIKWAWVLTSLYTGPIALAFYILADKEPRPGEHEQFTQPMWKQALGSTLHCVAGDATGIIIAATITGLLGLPMWFDMLAEYIFGFAFGLFIFQALFMKDMFGGSYWTAVRRSFMPEWLSMNTMMAGMYPAMVYFMMGRDMRAMDPRELIYWGVMSFAIGVGFLTAYPTNWWLVSKKLKHGLMTVRQGDTQAGTPQSVQPMSTEITTHAAHAH